MDMDGEISQWYLKISEAGQIFEIWIRSLQVAWFMTATRSLMEVSRFMRSAVREQRMLTACRA